MQKEDSLHFLDEVGDADPSSLPSRLSDSIEKDREECDRKSYEPTQLSFLSLEEMIEGAAQGFYFPTP